MDEMLVQSCDAFGAGDIKFSIKHYLAGMGCFASNSFGIWTATGCYNNGQIFVSLLGKQDIQNRYGKGMMSVRVT